jgi:hypothetical protein
VTECDWVPLRYPQKRPLSLVATRKLVPWFIKNSLNGIVVLHSDVPLSICGFVLITTFTHCLKIILD